MTFSVKFIGQTDPPIYHFRGIDRKWAQKSYESISATMSESDNHSLERFRSAHSPKTCGWERGKDSCSCLHIGIIVKLDRSELVFKPWKIQLTLCTAIFTTAVFPPLPAVEATRVATTCWERYYKLWWVRGEFTSLIEKGPGFMKVKTGASASSRVPITQERLGKNIAQPLPTV